MHSSGGFAGARRLPFAAGPGAASAGPQLVVKRPQAERADTLRMCKQLTDTMRLIYERRQDTCSFQQLHTLCHTIVTQHQGAVLSAEVEREMSERVALQSALVRTTLDPAFFEVLAAQWQRHLDTTFRTAQMLTFFNKNFCLAGGRPSVRAMAMRIFGDGLLRDPSNATRFKTLFLDIVRREREDEPVPQRTLLRTLGDMMIEVDHRGLFEELMERPFLAASREHYRTEAARSVSTASTPQFVARFLQRLAEERERVASYFEDATLPKIHAVLREEYIEPHKQQLLTRVGSGCRDMLSGWRTAELRDLFGVFAFAGDVAAVLAHTRDFFLREGECVVRDPQVCQQPVQFVERLVDLRRKMEEVAASVFVTRDGKSSKLVESELWRAFETVCNTNSATPDYMALYVDRFIRSNADEGEVDRACRNVMVLFRFLQDKDVFESCHKSHLARRLLTAKPNSSDDVERVMVGMLRKECGSHMTNKLEGMFKDRALSLELNSDFQQQQRQRQEGQQEGRREGQQGGDALVAAPLDLHVMVLTSGFWPPTPLLSCRLPVKMERALHSFRSFYLTRFKNRRLEFRLALGSLDMRMVHAGRRYELNVPTLCGPALLMFEAEGVVLTPAEIAERLGLELQAAVRALAALIRHAATHAPLLRLHPSASSGGAAPSSSASAAAPHEAGAAGASSRPAPPCPAAALTPTAPLTLNSDFRSRHLRIKVSPVAVVKEREEAVVGARERVDDDRKFKIDAAIVRVMKSRRSLDHLELIREVQHVTRRLFVPAMEEIKRRIEHLIEREFLERSASSRSTYNYLA